MTDKDDIWNAHQRKAEQAVAEARVLFNAGMYDGAFTLALGSCFQMARSVAVRLGNEHDPKEWLQAVRRMTKDGRLPESLMDPLFKVIRAQEEQLSSPHPCEAKRAGEAIELAGTFRTMVTSAAELTISMQSPKVKKALVARGMPTRYTF